MTVAVSKYSLLLLSGCALLLLAPARSVAKEDKDSLYNPKTATKLDPAKLSLFGPQASRFRYDQRMVHAAEIAQARAKGHSTSRCWRFVKTALLASKTISTYPKTAYAKQAGTELSTSYGFKKINVQDPFRAPVGSVIVYGGAGAGHVEIRTDEGFVSDFESMTPSPRPMMGVYVKPPA